MDGKKLAEIKRLVILGVLLSPEYTKDLLRAFEKFVELSQLAHTLLTSGDDPEVWKMGLESWLAQYEEAIKSVGRS